MTTAISEVKLKEKDIVNQIVGNWDKYFPYLQFFKTEWSFRNFRVDIAAGFDIDLKELGKSDSKRIVHAPVLFEVKYNSESRDLLFELQKQLAFREFYNKTNLCNICVISDKFDKTMLKFIFENEIHAYLIKIEDDITSLTLEELTHELIIEKEIMI